MGGLVSKHVTVALTEAIEAIRKDGLQPTHALN